MCEEEGAMTVVGCTLVGANTLKDVKEYFAPDYNHDKDAYLARDCCPST